MDEGMSPKLSDPELAFVRAILRSPAMVRERRELLGTSTLKERRRTVRAMRKEHGGPHWDCEVCDQLWVLESELDRDRRLEARREAHGGPHENCRVCSELERLEQAAPPNRKPPYALQAALTYLLERYDPPPEPMPHPLYQALPLGDYPACPIHQPWSPCTDTTWLEPYQPEDPFFHWAANNLKEVDYWKSPLALLRIYTRMKAEG